MSLKADQLVAVTINYRGYDGPGKLGWAWRDVMELKDGDWVKTGKREKIFGYCNHYDELTHMSYHLGDHFSTWNQWYDDLMEREFCNKDGSIQTGLDKFYLDAGGNGYPLYVKMDELKSAMIQLGLYREDSN